MLTIRREKMNMTAMKISGQESQEITPLKAVEAPQKSEQNVNRAQKVEKASTDAAKITTQEVKEVLESFKDLSKTIQTRLGFSVHEKNNEIVVSVFDKESNELIRQFPSDEMLDLQDKMSDMAGFLFNANV